MPCEHVNQDHLGYNCNDFTISWCVACGAHYSCDKGWHLPSNANVTQGPPPAKNLVDAGARLVIKTHAERIDALAEAFELQGRSLAKCLSFQQKLIEAADGARHRRQGRKSDISDD